MKNFILVITGIVFLVMSQSVGAAEAEKPRLADQIPPEVKAQNETQNKILTFSHENDSFGGGTDEYYTSGARVSLLDLDAQVPDFIYNIADSLPLVDLNEQTNITYSLGQNLYTPSDITIRNPQPNDRPYAGFLYGSAGLTTLQDDHIDEIEMTVGIVGPAALGEQTQKFIHKDISDSPEPEGWRHQLKNEPGLMVSAQRRYPKMWQDDFGNYSVSAGPYAGATLGNIYTYGSGGLTLVISPKDSQWQGMPVRVRPANPGSGYFTIPESGIDWSIFAGLEGRAMARNIFLDGNTFADSPSVDKKFFVGDANAGVAFTLGQARLSYSLVWRSKEFDDQDKDTVFGVINLGLRY